MSHVIANQTSTGAPRRIALLGPFGFGNLGDAAIQDSVIAAIRVRRPDVQIHGISLNPADTEARHGIPAHPLHPGHGAARGVLRRVARIGREVGFWNDARRVLRGFDLLVVSGGGQLDDSWGGPWRHPYALLRWSAAARLAGVPVVMLSLGAGPLHRRLSRSMVRRALALARYRSYRDEESRALVRTLKLGGEGPVVPDLAYGLPSAAPRGAGRVVGLSPMALFDPRAWPERDPAAYHAYLDRLAAVTERLLGEGRQVELFATNVRMDRPVLDDLRGRIAGGVRVAGTDSVGTLLDRLAGYDSVIVSRYHAALLAQVVGTPAVALAYHPKVRALMDAAGQGGYCLDARAPDVEAVVALLRRLSAERGSVVSTLRTHVAQCRETVERQFDLVFGPRVSALAFPRAPVKAAG